MKKSLLFSFIGLIIVCVATVGTILYANGYTYNLGTHTVQKTGVIKVSTTPGGADVYVDSTYEGSAPVSVYNLAPKQYLLTVKKNGYLPWTSKVSVTAGGLSSIFPVMLSSSFIPVRTKSSVDIQAVYFSADTYSYTVTDKSGGSDIYFHNFGSRFLNLGENTQFILNTQSLVSNPQYALSNIQTSPNDSQLLLTFSASDLPNMYFVTNSDGTGGTITINSLIDTSGYSSIAWGADDTHLILGNSSIIVSLDTTNGQRIILAQTDSQGLILQYSISNDFLYYISKQNSTYMFESVQLDGTQTTAISTYTSPISNLIAIGSNYAYTDNNGNINIYDPQLTSLPVILKTGITINPVSFSPDGKFLLYKDAQGNLNTYSIETNQTYSLGINLSVIGIITWDPSSQLLTYTTPQKNSQTGSTYYSIYEINFDGSNNDMVFSGSIQNPSVLPYSSNLYFEMANLSSNTASTDKGIYYINIPGI